MKQLLSLYKSMRVWVNTQLVVILGLMATAPDQVQTALGLFLGEQWVSSHWKAVVAITGLLGIIMHSYGSVRKGSEVPFEER